MTFLFLFLWVLELCAFSSDQSLDDAEPLSPSTQDSLAQLSLENTNSDSWDLGNSSCQLKFYLVLAPFKGQVFKHIAKLGSHLEESGILLIAKDETNIGTGEKPVRIPKTGFLKKYLVEEKQMFRQDEPLAVIEYLECAEK